MIKKILTCLLLAGTALSANAKESVSNAAPAIKPCTRSPTSNSNSSATRVAAQANVFNAIAKGADAGELALIIDNKNINASNSLGITLLMFSAVNGNWPAAKFLISMGANINLKTDAGTALLSAVAGNQYELAFKLIEAGAKLPSTCEDQYSMLRTAFIVEKAQYVDATVFIAYLLSSGFDANNMDDNQYTPIMAAVALNSESMANVLIAHGAIPTQKAKSGKNALDIASEKKNKKMLAILANSQNSKPQKN